MNYLGWLIGLDDTQITDVQNWRISLAAPWVQDNLFWLLLGCAAAIVLAIAFYLRFQSRGSKSARLSLGIVRGLLLALLLITLAIPVLQLEGELVERPKLCLLIDGTDSMAIEDKWNEDQLTELQEAAALLPANPEDETNEDTAPASRIDFVRSYLQRDDNVFSKLVEEKNVDLQAYVFDGNTTSRIRRIDTTEDDNSQVVLASAASDLSTTGQVTAIGAALRDLQRQVDGSSLAGVVMISDFDQNSGLPPVGNSIQSPAKQLKSPIYAVGIGATEAIDLAVDLQTDPKMKKAERTLILAKLRQSGLDGQSVSVTVKAKPLSGQSGEEIIVGTETVVLAGSIQAVEFPFTPDEAGRYEFYTDVEPIEGELIEENNHASREVNIIDDYLRLMYVAQQPTWEWRFIKEVFHRDKLVGMDGFRTFLASSDPMVRESNVLFLPTLTPKRSEFFSTDVVFLGDVPQDGISNRFAEMLQEYVGKLGGGLVVVGGPQFGIREFHDTPIEDMLPVVIDPTESYNDDREFILRRTAHADRYAFMRLSTEDVENEKAWKNLGKLPWYQPVAALHKQAFALAEHPTAMCNDGKTPQPIIAVRPYGKGEVVYVGYNEMWRMRRKFGEKYYRQFWSQLIYRLGMSHALGEDKRFVARLDRRQYATEDKVTFTVEAYNENYEPLTAADLSSQALEAELTIPAADGSEGRTQVISVPQLRDGLFELRFPVYAAGMYSLRLKDPVTGDFQTRTFEVTNLPAERLRSVRNVQLQQAIARESSGRSYELANVQQLFDDIEVNPIRTTEVRTHPLWTTPLWFILLVGLMLGEWFTRKMVSLR